MRLTETSTFADQTWEFRTKATAAETAARDGRGAPEKEEVGLRSFGC